MIQKTGIIGSGFGLYGHMPAYLLNYKGIVLLPKRYQEKFNGRPELKQFESRIEWLTNEEEVISNCNNLFIAQIPGQQETLIESALSNSNLSFLLLEKPLAKNPERAQVILNKLAESGLTYKIMYSFIYMDWYKKLKDIIKNESNCLIELSWKFKAHHFVHDLPVWKRFHSQGGGVLRFYGIHLLAMAAALQLKTIASSKMESVAFDEPYAWNARFEGFSGNRLQVSIDSAATDKNFLVRVTAASKILFEINENDPFFEYSANDGLDSRIDLNKNILQSLFSGQQETELYQSINNLWMQTEKLSA